MTNQAIMTILNSLCNQARDSVQATLGLIGLRGDASSEAWKNSLANSRSSADRLLRLIDDIRDLLASAPPPARATEQFDAAHCIGQAIELINLASGEPASGEPASRIVLEAPFESILIRQDRRTVEQVFTRILNAALKMGVAGDVHAALVPIPGRAGGRFAITPPDPSLAVRLVDWLNAYPDRIAFHEADAVTFAIAVMVAGRRLRSLGGTSEVEWPSPGSSSLAIFLPSQPEEIGNPNLALDSQAASPDSLSVLVAEDCDESYALTELLLRKENVHRARNGLEAVNIVRKNHFDVVFMDVHMPGMDGYAAIRAIRDWETQTATPRTVIVVLSSDELETQRRSAAQSGCSGFLRKPLRNNDLFCLLQRLKLARASVV